MTNKKKLTERTVAEHIKKWRKKVRGTDLAPVYVSPDFTFTKGGNVAIEVIVPTTQKYTKNSEAVKNKQDHILSPNRERVKAGDPTTTTVKVKVPLDNLWDLVFISSKRNESHDLLYDAFSRRKNDQFASKYLIQKRTMSTPAEIARIRRNQKTTHIKIASIKTNMGGDWGYADVTHYNMQKAMRSGYQQIDYTYKGKQRRMVILRYDEPSIYGIRGFPTISKVALGNVNETNMIYDRLWRDPDERKANEHEINSVLKAYFKKIP